MDWLLERIYQRGVTSLRNRAECTVLLTQCIDEKDDQNLLGLGGCTGGRHESSPAYGMTF